MELRELGEPLQGDAEVAAVDLSALHRERQARELSLGDRPRLQPFSAQLPRTTQQVPDWKKAFDDAHDLNCRIAHAVSFIALSFFLLIALFKLLFLEVTAALMWIFSGVVVATVIAKFGPRLQGGVEVPMCTNCVYSCKAWSCTNGRPPWRTVRDVEYESLMEVLIYYCTYRKTNCLTDTLYSGPREFGFIWRTVSAKIASLGSSGNGSSIFTGCQGPPGSSNSRG